MNYRIFCFLVALSTGVLPLWGQHLGTSLNLGLRKTFYFSEKNLWVLRQQVQLNPEIERLNNQYGDYFNEEGFWLIPDRYEAPDDDAAPDDDDEPDDDDGTPGNGNPPFFPELNDDPTRVMVEWRSTTSTVFTHKIRPWLRLNSAYAFFLQRRRPAAHAPHGIRLPRTQAVFSQKQMGYFGAQSGATHWPTRRWSLGMGHVLGAAF